MAFQKRRVAKKTPKKTTYKKRKYVKKKQQKNKGILSKAIIYSIAFLFICGVLGSYILYKKYIADLPKISELEKVEIAETSIMYDRDGNELYKIFEEKRIYKSYDDISDNMINALVSGEDKRYWENPGIDFIGLVRAVLYKVTGKSDKIEGTSTLTQQLIRNMIITNERTAERKIKEMYLAYNLTNSVSKEKILELYLNKISFGSNAFGIEQAAQTFFNTTAKDLSVLQSSMLASLPKGPTYYSPYNNFDRLVGYPYVYSKDDSENTTDLVNPSLIGEHQLNVNQLLSFLEGLKAQRYSDSKTLVCGLDSDKLKSNIYVDKDGCSVMDYSEFLTLLNSIKIESETKTIEYQTGRKDFILGRMLEDGYITFDEYKAALIESIGFEFSSYSEDIKYPHFVFYVREFLEEKYGRELLERGGLRIYTSIDPELQDKAQEIVTNQAASNETKFGAQNAALISIDNETGEILAMVGGKDYFDEENKGNVNIITSKLQPGSTFKPFVYSIAVDREVIGTKTPIYDVKTTFPGGYIPNNFDGKFMGKMDVTKALNYSRNVPAVKMFFLSGGEQIIIDWMKKLGVDSLEEFKAEYEETYGAAYSYGAAMSLGTALMTPLELAEAYSVYANMGYKKEIVPVIKIYDSDGVVIEEFDPETNVGEKVIDASTAFITNYMLSDTSSRPSFWNTYLSLNGRKAASKTGTSTKQETVNGKKVIYPRNLWTVGYTPQVTTVAWAGNNDGTQTNFSGNGLEAAGPIWKNFMEFVHKDKGALEWKMPSGVKQVNISDISGKLAPEGLQSNLVLSSLFVNAPQSYDNNSQSVQVDLLCKGAVNEQTPISAIGNVTLLSFTSLKPENSNWETPVQSWIRSDEFKSQYSFDSNFITSVSQTTCERTGIAGNIDVGASVKAGDTFVTGTNFLEIGYQSDSPLQFLDVFIGEQKISQIPLGLKSRGVYSGNIVIPKGLEGNNNLVIRAIDNQYYSQGTSYPINIIGKDTVDPEITLINPIDESISLFPEDFFNLRWEVNDRSSIRSNNIYIDGTPYKIGLKGREFTEEISALNLEEGVHIIKIESVDFEFNIGSKEVRVEVIPR